LHAFFTKPPTGAILGAGSAVVLSAMTFRVVTAFSDAIMSATDRFLRSLPAG
jgi:hypothetical protein